MIIETPKIQIRFSGFFYCTIITFSFFTLIDIISNYCLNNRFFYFFQKFSVIIVTFFNDYFMEIFTLYGMFGNIGFVNYDIYFAF